MKVGDRRKVIAVEAVSKVFARQGGGTVEAVRKVDFSVAENEFVCVVGPSGCGKSTVLKMLAGLVRPTSGQISLDGEAVTAPRRDVGIMFQQPVLLPWRTTLQNVMLPVKIFGLPKEPAVVRARKLLELVGLQGFEQSYPFELSGGMQQRAAIARALVHEPRILLMDEPFGALDAMTRQVMNVELTRIWNSDRKTVLLITHDISEAIFLADRVLVMSKRPGVILETLPIDLPRPRHLSNVAEASFGSYVTRIQQLLGLEEGASESPKQLERAHG